MLLHPERYFTLWGVGKSQHVFCVQGTFKQSFPKPFCYLLLCVQCLVLPIWLFLWASVLSGKFLKVKLQPARVYANWNTAKLLNYTHFMTFLWQAYLLDVLFSRSLNLFLLNGAVRNAWRNLNLERLSCMCIWALAFSVCKINWQWMFYLPLRISARSSSSALPDILEYSRWYGNGVESSESEIFVCRSHEDFNAL